MNITKFRGQILDGPRKGEWTYGSLITYQIFNREVTYIVRYTQDSVSTCGNTLTIVATQVDPKTVGQYTGLADKNSTEIYKDDMLNDKLGIGKVTWMAPSFVVVDFDGKLWNLGGGDVYPDGSTLKETEIIGNIHDHPDLLTQ